MWFIVCFCVTTLYTSHKKKVKNIRYNLILYNKCVTKHHSEEDDLHKTRTVYNIYVSKSFVQINLKKNYFRIYCSLTTSKQKLSCQCFVFFLV